MLFLAGLGAGHPEVFVGVLEAGTVEEGVETVYPVPKAVEEVIRHVTRGEEVVSNLMVKPT